MTGSQAVGVTVKCHRDDSTQLKFCGEQVLECRTGLQFGELVAVVSESEYRRLGQLYTSRPGTLPTPGSAGGNAMDQDKNFTEAELKAKALKACQCEHDVQSCLLISFPLIY